MANMAKGVNETGERTPLLQTPSSGSKGRRDSVLWRVLLCGFMVSLSFGVTQVP
jgi:hypothetical protein